MVVESVAGVTTDLRLRSGQFGISNFAIEKKTKPSMSSQSLDIERDRDRERERAEIDSVVAHLRKNMVVESNGRVVSGLGRSIAYDSATTNHHATSAKDR